MRSHKKDKCNPSGKMLTKRMNDFFLGTCRPEICSETLHDLFHFGINVSYNGQKGMSPIHSDCLVCLICQYDDMIAVGELEFSVNASSGRLESLFEMKREKKALCCKERDLICFAFGLEINKKKGEE